MSELQSKQPMAECLQSVYHTYHDAATQKKSDVAEALAEAMTTLALYNRQIQHVDTLLAAMNVSTTLSQNRHLVFPDSLIRNDFKFKILLGQDNCKTKLHSSRLR